MTDLYAVLRTTPGDTTMPGERPFSIDIRRILRDSEMQLEILQKSLFHLDFSFLFYGFYKFRLICVILTNTSGTESLCIPSL